MHTGRGHEITLGTCANLQFCFSSMDTEHTVSLIADVDVSQVVYTDTNVSMASSTSWTDLAWAPYFLLGGAPR